MTEQEWLAAADPRPMLEFLRGRVSDRRLRLFGVACACDAWYRLDERSRTAVRVAEEFADGLVDRSTLEEAGGPAFDVRDEFWDAGDEDYNGPLGLAESAAIVASVHEWESVLHRTGPFLYYPFDPVRPAHCALMRDIFGNPFRPVAVDPSWLTSSVIALAEGIYAGRVFNRVPVLADALQDAGCENEDILAHCRNSGPHVRGCWVVDLVLGKS